MAKIARKTQLVFGGALTAPSNIARFGSLRIGVPEFTLDPDDIQTTEYQNGWAAALLANKAPALQDLNALHYLHSLQLAYLMQQGIPEWDAATPYFIGSIVLAPDNTGKQYIAIADSLGSPVSTLAKWTPVDPGLPLGTAIATFPNLTGAYSCTATTAADAKGFVVCAGQVIVDASSPMNGVTIPNINGDVFLMGNAVAGTASTTANTAALAHNHTFTGTAGAVPSHTHNLDANGAAMLSYNMFFSGSSTYIYSGSQSVKSNVTVTYGDHNGPLGYHAQEWTDVSVNTRMIATLGGSNDPATALGGRTSTIASSPTPGTITPAGTTANNVSSFDIRPKYITAKYIMRIK